MPKRNSMEDLRDHLFEALERLKEAGPHVLGEEIERSKAIAAVTTQLVDTAKVELSFHKLTAESVVETTASRLLAASDQAE